MTRRRWISGVAVAMSWVGVASGTALGAAIPIPGAPAGVTLSVLEGNLDVADSYLPTVTIAPATRLVTGASVALRVNGLAGSSIRLQSSTAYPGTCTNFSAPVSDGTSSDSLNGVPRPDFTLDGNVLTSWDCGGTATLQITTDTGVAFTVKLPRDDNDNGIADFFEASLGAVGNALPSADLDVDGHSNFDEYRGFIVSGRHVRGNPLQKDVFIFLVNPQTTNSISLPAGPSLLGRLPTENRTVYPTDGTALTAFFDALQPVARAHHLGHRRDADGQLIFDGTNRNTDEIIDRLTSFSVVSGRETFVYRGSENQLITVSNLTRKSTPSDDRVVNKNRLFGPAQKAVRIIESLDVSKTSPNGSSTWGSPNGLNEAVIYTRRIVNYINSVPLAAGTSAILYATHTGTGWGPYQSTFAVPGSAPQPINRDFIISQWMKWVYPHEAIGHDLKLTVTATTLGYHDPTGTGGMLDTQAQIITTTNNTAANPPGLKFRIPSRFLSGHLNGIQVGTR